MTISNCLLRSADAEPAAGGGAGKTAEPAKSALELAMKVFSDEPDSTPDGVPAPGTTPKPSGEAASPGETVDLSQTPGAGNPPEETPGQKQQRENAAADPQEAEALAKRAKERGVTPEQQQADETAEQQRLDAVAAKTGETFEQIYEREEREGKPTEIGENGKPAKTYTQDEMEQTIQKRVKNLAAENAELKARLEQQPAAPVAQFGPLANVNDEAALTAARREAEAGLDEAEDLLSDLNAGAVDAVEAVVRKGLGASADQRELTPERLREILRNGQRNLKATLRAIPQRKEYLEVQKVAHAKALQDAPWITNSEDPRTVLTRQLEQAIPQVKVNPTWEYLLSAAAEKILERQQQSPRGSKGAAVKLRLKSALPGTGRVAPVPKGGRPSFANAKAKGDVGAMGEAVFG